MDTELHSKRRRYPVEGQNGSHSNLSFVSARPSIRSPHLAARPWALRGKSPCARGARSPRATLTTKRKPRQTVDRQNTKAPVNALTLKLSSLTTRNAMLLKEVEKMKTTVSKDKTPGAEDQLRLLTETGKLLAENGHMAVQSKQLLQHRQEISEGAHKAPELGCFPTSSPKWFESTLGTLRDEKLKHEESSQICAPKQKNVAVSELQKALAEQAANLTSLQKENAELQQQNNSLSTELSNVRKTFQQLEDQFKQATSFSSESRLRYALCDTSSSIDDLKQAINASEALLNEAKREHANKKFRAKRAALEMLEMAVEKAEEEILSAAIVTAQEADVDAVDVEKGEEKLKTLRSMTQEQHAAKGAREVLQKQKKTAFMLVKKDDVIKFKELITEVGEGVSWCDWRDPLGRTVWRYAKDVQAPRMQEFLKQLGVGDEQASAQIQQPMLKQRLHHIEQQQQQQQQHQQQHQQQRQQQQEDTNQTQSILVDEHMDDAPNVEHSPSLDLRKCLAHVGMDSNCSTLCPAVDSITIAKSKAFRAVAQDDSGALNEVIESVSVDTWSKWENRAGKTLLTLSEERKSGAVHSQIAKALGILKQSKRETFQEHEAVWIYVQGDVQPKRATVLADTVEDAQMIPIEYWEGNAPATCVKRCSIRKMFS